MVIHRDALGIEKKFQVGYEGFDYISPELWKDLKVEELKKLMNDSHIDNLFVEIYTYDTKRTPEHYIFDYGFSVIDECIIIPDNPIMVAEYENMKQRKLIINNKLQQNPEYDYIDGFDQGYARVFREDQGWGIINRKMKEVLPLSRHCKVRRFYGNGSYKGTYVEYNDGRGICWFDFEDARLTKHIPAHTSWYSRDVNRRVYRSYSEWKYDTDEFSVREDDFFCYERDTSTGEEWDTDSDGDYIPDWLYDKI